MWTVCVYQFIGQSRDVAVHKEDLTLNLVDVIQKVL